MKLKVLQIVYSGVGGTGSVATSIIEGDKKKDFIHEILFTGVDKIFEGYKEWCNKKKINYYNHGLIKNFLVRDYKIFKIIKKIKPQIVIFHGDNYLMTIILSIFYNFKLIYVEHNPIAYRTKKNYLLNYITFIFFDKIIYLYNAYRTEILKKQKILNFFRKKITIIPNGVSINKNIIKIKSKKFRIGMVSRFSAGKQQMLLVHAILRLKKEHPKEKFKLELVGNGENLYKIEKMIKDNNLEEQVTLIRSLPEHNLKKWFTRIDLYCHLSDDEGVSTAILHALSNKTLLLVSKNQGNKFLKTNAFFTINKISNIINKIVFIKKNINSLNKKINNGHFFFKNKYSNEIMFKSYSKEFIRLYEKKN